VNWALREGFDSLLKFASLRRRDGLSLQIRWNWLLPLLLLILIVRPAVHPS
jgi:hypothetical protein